MAIAISWVHEPRLLVATRMHGRARSRRRKAAVPRDGFESAGHCLAAGLLNREQAEALAGRLMSDDDMLTGWGDAQLWRTPVQLHELSQRFGMAAR